jgi:hypothetical protein
MSSPCALNFLAFHFKLIQHLWYHGNAGIRFPDASFGPQDSQYGALKWTAKFRNGEFDCDVLGQTFVKC